MGTRADFYVGKGKTAEWLGSIAWDGHPESIDDSIKLAPNELEYRNAVRAFFASRDDVTLPEQGWPWPWKDSNTTDFSYTFDADKVWATCFGHGWWEINKQPEDLGDNAPKIDDWPQFKNNRNPSLGSKRSGIMVICR
jgi:hypothetical protein